MESLLLSPVSKAKPRQPAGRPSLSRERNLNQTPGTPWSALLGSFAFPDGTLSRPEIIHLLTS